MPATAAMGTTATIASSIAHTRATPRWTSIVVNPRRRSSGVWNSKLSTPWSWRNMPDPLKAARAMPTTRKPLLWALAWQVRPAS